MANSRGECTGCLQPIDDCETGGKCNDEFNDNLVKSLNVVMAEKGHVWKCECGTVTKFPPPGFWLGMIDLVQGGSIEHLGAGNFRRVA